MSRTTGLIIIAVGALLLVVGAVAAAGGLSWFGRLPGDIRVERDGIRVYVPLVSMLLASAALTAIANIVAFLLRRQ